MHITNDRPTEQAYGELQLAYDHFNHHLFDDRLPPCLITLRIKGRRTLGYFAPGRFKSANDKLAHEIALNARYFNDHGPLEVLSTLAHEMVHLWPQECGRPSRGGYHNREWAREMLRLGLHPSHTGAPGGRMLGQQMSHYIVKDGLFERVANALIASNFSISWFDTATLSSGPPVDPMDIRALSGKRIKFICACPARVWGKASLNVLCLNCETVFRPL